MKFISLSIIFFACSLSSALAQDIAYTADNIPEALKKNASVIKRLEENQLEVPDMDHATYSHHSVITVMSESGEDALRFMVYTDEFMKLNDAEIKVYDAKGKLKEKFKKKDFIKRAPYGDAFLDDYMGYYLKIIPSAYPLTIEYKFSQSFDGSYYYPRYSIINPGEALEKSSYIVKIGSEVGLRYKEQKIKLPPKISSDSKYKIYEWSVSNLPAFEYEEGAVAGSNAYPSILLAPDQFKFYHTQGEMTSWKSYGAWNQNLYTGLDELSAERKAFYAGMVKDATSEKEKIARVYQYLQKNFRYVSIQLGIGGMKPFAANFTESKKYGDCKALSFYTYSVLKSLGINSHVALINAGYNMEPVDVSFPCGNFNHMILCVPQAKDSIWLECTSNTSEFGVLGAFTENRKALLITPSGGVLISTPRSKSSDNLSNVSTTIILNEDGSGKTSTMMTRSGYFKDIIHELMASNKEEQKDFLIHSMGFKQPDEFKFSAPFPGNETVTSLELSIESIPEFKAGSKMFLNPRIYKFYDQVLPKSENRKQDYYFRAPFEKTDTTTYILPEGFRNEALPKSRDSKCEYADYSTKYWYNEDKKQIICVARLGLKQNRIPSEKYAEVKKFFDEVYADGGQKIVIRKQD